MFDFLRRVPNLIFVQMTIPSPALSYLKHHACLSEVFCYIPIYEKVPFRTSFLNNAILVFAPNSMEVICAATLQRVCKQFFGACVRFLGRKASGNAVEPLKILS